MSGQIVNNLGAKLDGLVGKKGVSCVHEELVESCTEVFDSSEVCVQWYWKLTLQNVGRGA